LHPTVSELALVAKAQQAEQGRKVLSELTRPKIPVFEAKIGGPPGELAGSRDPYTWGQN